MNKASQRTKRLLSVVLLVVTGIAVMRCAHPVQPIGGPKDITPPVPLGAYPPNYSTHFNSSKITIDFDEFLQLKDPSKEIFVSPPMAVKPEYKLRGKSLLIEFREPLKENTTYTLYFGNAIADLNEGNPVSGFEYVFSTGDVIDSLSISGQVLNAFDLQPEKDVLVMVYADNNDTIPFDSLPLRISPLSASRTRADGSFIINNLKYQQYKLVALQDQNNNFYYDLPGERIAFSDRLVTPEYIEKSEPDSNTAVKDSLTVKEEPAPQITRDYYQLYMFEEIDSIQRITGRNIKGNSLITYNFRFPVNDVRIIPLNFDSTMKWELTEFTTNRDTLMLWLMPGVPDTLQLLLQADSSINDTSRFIIKEEAGGIFRRKSGDNLVSISSSASLFLDLNKEFHLIFSGPVDSIDFSGAELMEAEDTLKPVITLTGAVRRKVVVEHSWKPGARYRLSIPDSSVFDYFGHTNKATDFSFKVRVMEDYAILTMQYVFSDTTGQYIFQFMNPKEAILNQRILSTSGTARYEYLLPAAYRIKAIYDRNGNGRWDTGNYGLGIQPEKVYYFPKELNLRANWELQEEWILGQD